MGISGTIWEHLGTKKPTLVGYFASAMVSHLVDDFAKLP
jgi:hypothetical protein